MKKLKVFSVCCSAAILLVGVLFATPALAIPGDVNGDEQVSISDVVYLYKYLLEGGAPPPNPVDADVDGTAGINLGDVLQLMGYLFYGCELKAYTGVVPYYSDMEFFFPVITAGGAAPFSVPLTLTDNPGPDLMGTVISFSYQHDPGHVGVDLDTVDFTGSIIPAGWGTQVYIDNVNKRAVLVLHAPSSSGTPLGSGTTGLVATLTFTRTENPSDSATFLRPTVFPPSSSPLLIGDFCAGTPTERALIPKYVLGKNGDVNCDGVVSIGDVQYLVNYLFYGGPPPCIW